MNLFKSNYMMGCCFHLDYIYNLLSIIITNNKVKKSVGLGTDYLFAFCFTQPQEFHNSEGESKDEVQPRTGHEGPEGE